MRPPRGTSLLLVLLALGACDSTPAPAEQPAKTKAEAEPVAEANAIPTRPPSSAAGDKPEAAKTETDCPKSLQGRDEVSRVITKDCGVVPVTGEYTVDSGATLTLEPGATLAFAPGASLVVGYYKSAKLVVKGTADEPVTFTSSGDKAPGVWKGVRLHRHAARSELTGLVLEHAGDKDGALWVGAEDVELTDITVRSVKGPGVHVETREGFAMTGGSITGTSGPAIQSTAAAAGGIAAGVGFDGDSRILVDDGKIETEVSWATHPVPYVVVKDVEIDGRDGQTARLNLGPGAQVLFDADARLLVGYYQRGELVAKGTEVSPVTFGASGGASAGSWKHVAIYGRGIGRFEWARFRHGGRDEEDGVLRADGKAELSVISSFFEDNAAGVKINGNQVKLTDLSGCQFANTPKALRMTPEVFLGVKGGNVYDEAARIVLGPGKIERDGTWSAQGAVVELSGKVSVDAGAKLTIEGGSTFEVEDGATVDVGYYKQASLRVAGTPDKPVVFRGLRDAEGTWGPIHLHPKASGNELRHVSLRNAKGPGGVVVGSGVDLVVDTLSCESCTGGALSHGCDAKVEAKAVTTADDDRQAVVTPPCEG